MNNISSRIKEERTRLGLSQEAFGKLGGVKKLAQLNYEKGNRHPTGVYLEQLNQHIDIDINYIVTGVRDSPEQVRADAENFVLASLATTIGIDLNDLYNVCQMAVLREIDVRLGEKTDPSKLVEAVKKLIPEHTKAVEIDITLLTDIIEKIEDIINSLNYKLLPAKKSQVIAMLYRIFVSSGKIDHKMIEEAVSIATK